MAVFVERYVLNFYNRTNGSLCKQSAASRFFEIKAIRAHCKFHFVQTHDFLIVTLQACTYAQVSKHGRNV